MTASKMDVRELNQTELDFVAGGIRLRPIIWALDQVGRALTAYQLVEFAKDNPMQGHDYPRPVSYGV